MLLPQHPHRILSHSMLVKQGDDRVFPIILFIYSISSKTFLLLVYVQSEIYSALRSGLLPENTSTCWLVCPSQMTTCILFSTFSKYPCALCFQDCCYIPCEKQEMKIFHCKMQYWVFLAFLVMTYFCTIVQGQGMENFKKFMGVWESSHVGSDDHFLFYLPYQSFTGSVVFLGRVTC